MYRLIYLFFWWAVFPEYVYFSMYMYTVNVWSCFQVLNLENNKLRKLPADIGHLQCLQTLNLKCKFCQ